MNIIGIDTSGKSSRLRGMNAEGESIFRKTLSRSKFLAFLSEAQVCLAMMATFRGTHHCGRKMFGLRKGPKMIPPV